MERPKLKSPSLDNASRANTAGLVSIGLSWYNAMQARPLAAGAFFAGSALLYEYAKWGLRKEVDVNARRIKNILTGTAFLLRIVLAQKYPDVTFPKDFLIVENGAMVMGKSEFKKDESLISNKVEADLRIVPENITLERVIMHFVKARKAKLPSAVLVYPFNQWRWNRYDGESEVVRAEGDWLITRKMIGDQAVDFWTVDLDHLTHGNNSTV